MNEQEKARELVERFENTEAIVFGCTDEMGQSPCIISNKMQRKSAKQCALICVEEAWEEATELHRMDYWKNVKSEIEKL